MRSMITGRYRIKETAMIGERLIRPAPLRLNRRKLLMGLGAVAAAAPLSACDTGSPAALNILDKAEALTKAAQRALLGPRDRAGAGIPPGANLSLFQAQWLDRSRGSRLCRAARRRLQGLEFGGRRPCRAADEALARRSSRPALAHADHPPRLRRGLELHRPVEGRAVVAGLNAAGLKPQARYIAFFCADTLEQTLDSTGPLLRDDRSRSTRFIRRRSSLTR